MAWWVFVKFNERRKMTFKLCGKLRRATVQLYSFLLLFVVCFLFLAGSKLDNLSKNDPNNKCTSMPFEMGSEASLLPG